MPVASITFSSATRANCSRRIRWVGSTFGSAVPPVATLRAKERVISHWLGALVPSMFMRSPSKDWNGLPASPGSGGAMLSCYGEETLPGASASGSTTCTDLVSDSPARTKVTVSVDPGGSA